MDNVKKLFVQALIEAENKEISKLKGEDEIEWEFSEKFENSMNKLIRKNIHIRLSTRRTVRSSYSSGKSHNVYSVSILSTGKTEFLDIVISL